MSESILDIQNLEKRFREKVVLDKINLSVPRGTIFGFLGRNGAGKTTTMKTIVGLIKANKGQVRVAGETVQFGETATNRLIGYLPDVPIFYNYMSASEYLKLCGEITGIPKKERSNRINEMLELVGLKDNLHRISTYSRGMKQRLGIAQALLNRPQLLICDEPTSALDPIGRKEILDILQQVKQQTTVLFSTHILSDAEQICDEIVILDHGKIVLNGNLDEILQRKQQDEIQLVFENKSELERFLAVQKVFKPEQFQHNGEGRLTLKTDGVKKAQLDLMQLLVSEKIVPLQLEIVQPSLEKVFLEVVQ